MKRLLPALALLLVAACPASADVVIGAAAPFSGSNAALGEQLRRGVQLAVDDINATGGVRGERLSVSFADDGCDPRKAVEVATGFVSGGVKAVIGHYCSGSSIPASKVYEKGGLVQISPASTHPKYTDEGGWNVFRICPRDDAQALAAAELTLARFPGRRIAILHDQSTAQRALADRFRTTLAGRGITPVLDDNFKPGSKDYSALAERLRTAQAEVLYLAGSYVESGLIARELRDVGSSAQIIGTDALVTEEYGIAAKEAADGTLMTFTFDPRKFPAARSALERFRQADYGAEGFTLYAYAAVQAWVRAVEATGTTDGPRVAEWLRGGNRVATVTGDIGFDPKGDLVNPRVAWFKWIDGRYAEIDPATLQPPQLDTTP